MEILLVFSHKLLDLCLRPSMCTFRVIKSCLIWTSLCMLFEVVTIDLHYMTDRYKRFDLKISKL